MISGNMLVYSRLLFIFMCYFISNIYYRIFEFVPEPKHNLQSALQSAEGKNILAKS